MSRRRQFSAFLELVKVYLSVRFCYILLLLLLGKFRYQHGIPCFWIVYFGLASPPLFVKMLENSTNFFTNWISKFLLSNKLQLNHVCTRSDWERVRMALYGRQSTNEQQKLSLLKRSSTPFATRQMLNERSGKLCCCEHYVIIRISFNCTAFTGMFSYIDLHM